MKGRHEMKQLIVAVGLALLGLCIFRMMITDSSSMYNIASDSLRSVKEYYICTN